MYMMIKQKRAVKKALRITPLIPDLAKLVIYYAKPTDDMIRHIYSGEFVHSDILTNSVATYESIIMIKYTHVHAYHRCIVCHEKFDHVCMHWKLNGDSFNTSPIPLCAIIDAACTGDISDIEERMYPEHDTRDIKVGLSDEQLDVWRGEQERVVHAAILEFIDSLIW